MFSNLKNKIVGLFRTQTPNSVKETPNRRRIRKIYVGISGETGTGKYTLLLRIANNKFREYRATVCDFIRKHEVVDGTPVEFLFFSSLGGEKFQRNPIRIGLIMSHYCILVLTFTDRHSFDLLLTRWLSNV
jgi:GTPase SAR1 family protein